MRRQADRGRRRAVKLGVGTQVLRANSQKMSRFLPFFHWAELGVNLKHLSQRTTPAIWAGDSIQRKKICPLHRHSLLLKPSFLLRFLEPTCIAACLVLYKTQHFSFKFNRLSDTLQILTHSYPDLYSEFCCFTSFPN